MLILSEALHTGTTIRVIYETTGDSGDIILSQAKLASIIEEYKDSNDADFFDKELDRLERQQPNMIYVLMTILRDKKIEQNLKDFSAISVFSLYRLFKDYKAFNTNKVYMETFEKELENNESMVNFFINIEDKKELTETLKNSVSGYRQKLLLDYFFNALFLNKKLENNKPEELTYVFFSIKSIIDVYDKLLHNELKKGIDYK